MRPPISKKRANNLNLSLFPCKVCLAKFSIEACLHSQNGPWYHWDRNPDCLSCLCNFPPAGRPNLSPVICPDMKNVNKNILRLCRENILPQYRSTVRREARVRSGVFGWCSPSLVINWSCTCEKGGQVVVVSRRSHYPLAWLRDCLLTAGLIGRGRLAAVKWDALMELLTLKDEPVHICFFQAFWSQQIIMELLMIRLYVSNEKQPWVSSFMLC